MTIDWTKNCSTIPDRSDRDTLIGNEKTTTIRGEQSDLDNDPLRGSRRGQAEL